MEAIICSLISLLLVKLIYKRKFCGDCRIIALVAIMFVNIRGLLCMQTVGTHNSYHITPDKKIVEFLSKKTTKILLGKRAAEELPDVWEATMKPLSQQLQQLGECRMWPNPSLSQLLLTCTKAC